MTSYRPRLNEQQRKEILKMFLVKLNEFLEIKTAKKVRDNEQYYTDSFRLMDKFIHPEPLNKQRVYLSFWYEPKNAFKEFQKEVNQRIKEIKTILKNGFPKTSESEVLEPVGRSV